MNFTPEVIRALQILKDAAETDSEQIAIEKLETDLQISAREVWRDVIGYEGLYRVSNLGRIKSYQRKSPTLLVVDKTNHSYAKVLLSKNGCAKTVLVHRLVAQAFIPNPLNLPQQVLQNPFAASVTGKPNLPPNKSPKFANRVFRAIKLSASEVSQKNST